MDKGFYYFFWHELFYAYRFLYAYGNSGYVYDDYFSYGSGHRRINNRYIWISFSGCYTKENKMTLAEEETHLIKIIKLYKFEKNWFLDFNTKVVDVNTKTPEQLMEWTLNFLNDINFLS